MNNHEINIWRPYTQMQTAPLPQKIQRAQGSYLFLEKGQKVLDGISSWWLITHGHCHPHLVEAVSRQAAQLDQVIFANFSHDPAEELVHLLAQFLPPALNSFFFSDNGSTAVEVAMKMAYHACQQKGKMGKTKFLAFEHAYHGDTCGAMSVSGDGVFTQAYRDLRFKVLRCPQGKISSEPLENWLAPFRAMMERHHQEIAAVIVEPLIQGAGGMIMWPATVLQEMRKICSEFSVLLIFDEVMTGFGRCGEIFAFQKAQVIPDLVCLSKGLTGGMLPLSVTVVQNKIYESFLSHLPEKMFFHGHSFTANPIACAAAVANLKLFRDPQILLKIKEIEKAHLKALSNCAATLPVRDMRVLGAVGALELNWPQSHYGSAFSQTLTQNCLKEGLFIRPLGNVVYLMPPYCTTCDEVLMAWEIVKHNLGLLLS